ncbi:uncharacterized protein J3R85_005554 [Psidium guajava]|nr:uncharacterized protein J3R85_005554 [Psidium guajava]
MLRKSQLQRGSSARRSFNEYSPRTTSHIDEHPSRWSFIVFFSVVPPSSTTKTPDENQYRCCCSAPTICINES